MPRDPSVIAHQCLPDLTAGRGTSFRTAPATPDAGTGLTALLCGDVGGARAELARCGFTITEDVDPVTGRPYLLARSGSSTKWPGGLFLVDRSAAPSLCVGVPRATDDQPCVDLGLRLWRAVPGSLLALAAAPRGNRGRGVDQTHDTASPFHAAWALAAGPRGMTQVQIVRFDGRPPRGPAGWGAWGHTRDVVVSVGSADVTLPALRIVEQVEAIGQDVRRDWNGPAPEVSPYRTNPQSLVAGRRHWAWAVLALGPMVHSTPARWQALADAVAQADPARYRLVDLGTSSGGRVVVDASLGDHYLLRLESDVALDLAGEPAPDRRILLRLEAPHDVRRARVVAIGAGAVTVVPGRTWYGVLRRDADRWSLVQSLAVPSPAVRRPGAARPGGSRT
jgi:hypothetical protein